MFPLKTKNFTLQRRPSSVDASTFATIVEVLLNFINSIKIWLSRIILVNFNLDKNQLTLNADQQVLLIFGKYGKKIQFQGNFRKSSGDCQHLETQTATSFENQLIVGVSKNSTAHCSLYPIRD